MNFSKLYINTYSVYKCLYIYPVHIIRSKPSTKHTQRIDRDRLITCSLIFDRSLRWIHEINVKPEKYANYFVMQDDCIHHHFFVINGRGWLFPFIFPKVPYAKIVFKVNSIFITYDFTYLITKIFVKSNFD